MKGLSITNNTINLEFNIENFSELVEGIDIQNLQVNGSNLLSASLTTSRDWDFSDVIRNDNILNLSAASMDGISVNNIDPLFTLNLTLEENWSLITLSAPTLTVNDIDYQFTDLTIANTKETDSFKIHNLEYLENSDSNYHTQFVELSGGQTLVTHHSGDGYNLNAKIIGESSTLPLTFNTMGSISSNPEAIELLNGNIFFVYGKKGQVISLNNEVIKPIFDVTENGAFWSSVDRNPITNEIIVLSSYSGIDNNGIVVSEFNSDISEKINEKVILSIPKDPEEYVSSSPFGTTPIFDARFSKEGDLFIVRSENKGFETERGNIYIQKFDNNFNLISEKVLVSSDLNADSGFPRLTIQDEKIFVNWFDRDYEIYKSYQQEETKYTQKFLVLDKDLNTLSNELEFHFPKKTTSQFLKNESYFYDNGGGNEAPTFVLYDNDVTYRAILETGTYTGLDIADNFNAENSSGSVIIDGKRGNDIITGSQFADIIKGGLGNDNVFGEDGDDKFIYSNGNDTISGGLGTDLIELFQNQFSEIQNVRKNNDDYIIEFYDSTLTLNSVETVKDINGLSKNIDSLFNEFKNFPPTSISLDASSVIENDIGGHIANITGEDPDDDSLTYTVLSGQDSGLVEVDGTTVKFKDGVSADYELDQFLEFTLRATDQGGLSVDKSFSLNVLDDTSDNNKAPTFESEIISYKVTVSYGTNDYSTGNKYYINDEVSPSLNLMSGKTYEFDLSEVPSSHPFHLSTISHGSLNGGSIYNEVTRTSDKLTITVYENTPALYYFCSNHKGMGSSLSIINETYTIDENLLSDTVIYNANAIDVDGDTLTYSLSGTEKDYFRIDSDDGEVRFLQSADYETKSSYLFDVTVSDGELFDTKTIYINIADDVSDNFVNLTEEDLALKEEHYGSDLADKMDAGDLLSNLKLYGGKGNDELLGGKGHDELHGGDDNDTLEGQDGNDTLIGGKGNDILKGGSGNDILNGGSGNEVMIGGDGIDTLVYEGAINTQVYLTNAYFNKGQNTGHGWDKIDTKYIENITTDAGNDIIKGQWLDNVLSSGSGNDKLEGNRGNDTLKGGGGFDILNGGSGNDRLEGNRGNDTLIGGSGNDTLKGGGGSDILNGGSGNDVMIGGDGIDTLVYEGNVNTQVHLTNAYFNKGQNTGHGWDKIDTKYIENITTDAGNDIIKGQWLDNVLSSGSGNDKLEGNRGNDTLKGGGGFDILNGGSGNDRLEGNRGNDTLIGGSGNDTLKGGGGSDILNGGSGNDVMIGGDGIDTLVYEGNVNTQVHLTNAYFNKGQNTGHGWDKIDTKYIENITTDAGNDIIKGQWLDNVLSSGSGNDKLEGNRGNDTLIGGSGNDTLKGGGGSDIFQFSANNGQDTIEDFNVSQGDKIRLMKSENDSSEISYTSNGNHTIINWENVSITVNNVQDQDQIAQQIEWMAII